MSSLSMAMRSFASFSVCCLLITALGGCSPSLSPLYRDFEVRNRAGADEARIEAALEQAGWSPAPDVSPSAVTTEERTLTQWGLYKVTARLEVVPLGDGHVRVLVHPYRKFVTGSRSKIPYLSRSLRNQLLPDLNKAFEAQGLHAVGTAVERDREDTAS